MATTSITWQNLTNAVLNGSGQLEKNAGSDNCFVNASGTGDAGARSVETISGGNWEFQCTLGPDPSGRTFIGLDSGTFSLDFTTWQYCLHVSTEANTSGTPHPADSIFVYEGSPPNKTYLDGVWNEGDLLRFVCVNNVVRYYHNSNLLYTSSAAPSYPLFVCVSLACLGKTVVDPVLITSAGTGACEEGISTGDNCSAPWTIPTVSVLPLTNPKWTYFQEIEGDWGEFGGNFPDGTPNKNTIQTAAVRRWVVEWDGLDEADAAILDAHWESTRGGLKFTMQDPHTLTTINGVRYESYDRPDHRVKWSQKRTAKLIKFTS